MVDRAHCGIACLVIVGATPIDTVAETLIHLTTSEPSISAIVLATVRPGRGHRPDPDDHLAFTDVRHSFDEVGIDLLDWFVVDGGRAASLAELTDARSRWRPR